MKKAKKFLSVLLSVVMILSIVSCFGTVAFAEDSEFVIEGGTLFEYNGKGGDVVIPDGVTSINGCAFSEREDITSVKIPDSVKSIDKGAFEDCTNLISVTLPNGLKTIESETFFNCIKLTNVIIPDSVESIRASAFENCVELKSVIIPNSVKSIGICAFNNCICIESITISDNVTDIGVRAFGYCENLKDVYVSCDSDIDSVQKIMQSFGDYTYTQLDHKFTDNKCQVCGITEFDIIDGVLYGYYGNGGDVVIPDGVTSIKGAFSNCSSVTSVTIPNSVTSIGAKSFENCVSLTSVVIPCSVKSIGDYAFESCVSLSSITISGNIDIGDSVFDDCGRLVNVYCNCDSDIESVKAFMEDYGRYMFTYTQLDHKFTDNKCQACGITEFDIIDGVLYGYYGNGGDVVIPDGVTSIKGAFSNCSSVTSVTIPNSVTSIGAKSFENCVSLTSVVIPCSVKSIGDYAFESCVSLSSITISGNIDIGDSVFDDCGRLVNVYCNCDSDIESVKAFMEDYGRYMFTYTQLDHNFVDGVCTFCGAFNELKQAKADAIAEIEKSVKENVPSAAQELNQFKNTVNNIKDNINSAANKNEVDEALANGLKALDEFVPETFSVSVTDGATVSKSLNLNKSAKYEIATVKIAESDGIKDGSWFVYWVDGNGNIVSTYSTYSFFVVENRKLTPVYVSPDVYETERAKAVLVTDIVRADNNGDGTATIFAEHSASKAAVGGEISQHGVIWTTDASQSGSLTLDNANVSKSVATKTNKALTGLFRVNIEVEENSTVYAKSYVTDADGNTTYSDIKTMNVGSFSTSSVENEILTCASFDSSLAQADEIIPTAEEITEPEAPAFMSILMIAINALIALFNSIIALF